ncbi:putative lipid II flippase FtsW [soil metagenome]
MTVIDRAKTTLERPLASYHLILGVSALLMGLGLVMVLSASSVFSFERYGSSYYIFTKQLIFAVLGLSAAFVASKLPIRIIRMMAYPGLIIALGAICLTLVPGIGVNVKGNQNWISAGPIRIQPSELAKLALILWSADLFARKEKLLGNPRHVLIPMLPVAALVAGLVVVQHDLGTAIVIAAIVIGMLWAVGLPGRYMAVLACAAGGIVIYLAATSDNRARRMMNFLNPFADADSSGYQVVHSNMALATGQFWGSGLGAGQQKWGRLPEAHTDFIFAVIGEELGLFGTLITLGLFGLLAYACIRIASRARDPFARYAAAGIAVWFMVQVVINVGMVLGLLPVIGIPLPFISYGGSGLLTSLVAVGLLVNFAKFEPGAQRALKSGKGRR